MRNIPLDAMRFAVDWLSQSTKRVRPMRGLSPG
jgi:hypothetical protein